MTTFMKSSGYYESYNNGDINDLKSFDITYDGDVAFTKFTDNQEVYYSLLNNNEIKNIVDDVSNILKMPNNKHSLSLRLLKDFPINKKAITPLTSFKSRRTTNKSRPSLRSTRKKRTSVKSIDKTIY